MISIVQTDAASSGSPAPDSARPARPPVRLQRQGKGRRNRRQDILTVLAQLLEDPQCDRITTALIAKKLDLSEAALYRSFPSKAAMFDGLIEFIETTLLDLFGRIREDRNLTCVGRVEMLVTVLLNFSAANPGLTRVMTGQVLMKEDPRLMERMTHLADRLEMGLRLTYRDAVLARELPANFDADGRANLVMSWVLGRLLRFVMTGFRARPDDVNKVTLAPFFIV